jgi:L-lactate dehydrogenase complex protein LldE
MILHDKTKEAIVNTCQYGQWIDPRVDHSMEEVDRMSENACSVALFSTCINDVMYPESCLAAVTVLERLGCKVSVPYEQTCCGQIFSNTGYFKEALRCVKSYVEAFSDYDYVVGVSGSCVTAVRDQHPMLAAKLGDSALRLAVQSVVAKTYEFTEFIVDVLGLRDVGAFFPHTVTFHLTCHSLRMAKLGTRPMQLMEAVSGLELIDLNLKDTCCGFGGTFSLKNAALSAALVTDKAAHVQETKAEYLVTVDNACALNIGGRLHREGSPIKTLHLAEVLASTKDRPYCVHSKGAVNE